MVKFGVQRYFGSFPVFTDEICRDFVLCNRHKQFYLTLALHHQTYCHRLHTSGTQSGRNLAPQNRTKLKTYYTVEHATRLLRVNQIIIYIARMSDGLFDGRLCYLVECYTMGVLGL